MKIQRSSQKILAVLCYLRSGSGFMSSLLDGHPNIITTPDDIIKDFYNFWDKYSSLDYEKLGKKFTENFNIIFNSKQLFNNEFYDNENFGSVFFKKKLTTTYNLNKLGHKENKSIKVDKKKFLSLLKKKLKNKKKNRKSFFLAIHYAYHRAKGLKVSTNPIISFPLHAPNYKTFKDFNEDFPNAKYICMIRNPVETFLAQLNVAKKKNYLSQRIIFYYLNVIFNNGNKPNFISKKNWKNIKLERLHLKKDITLKEISNFLKIKKNNNLYFSTWNNLSWHNETSSKKLNGFDKDILKRKYENISNKNEKNLLKFFFKKKAKSLNYKNDTYHFFNDFFLNIIKLIKPFRFELFIFDKLEPKKIYPIEIKKIQKFTILKKIYIFFKYYLKIRLLLLKKI